MRLDITFRRAPEFEFDVAHYAVPEPTLRRIEDQLRANPLGGVPTAGEPRTRQLEVGDLRVTYLLLEAEERIWLVRIAPREEPKPRFAERAEHAVKLVNDLKRLLLDW